MKKYLIVLFLIAFIIPSIALASWWNPFSWFKKTPKYEQTVTQVQPINSQIEAKKPTQEKTVEQPQVNKKVTKPIKKENSPTSTTIPISTVPAVVAPPVQNPTTQLIISDITFNSTSDSANISWKTNINSESKVILNGDVYHSKSGVDMYHYALINNLNSDQSYTGTITALANNAWESKTFSFSTQKAPLKILSFKADCLIESCTVTWETNSLSNGIVTFTNSSQTRVGVSQNKDSMNHSVLIITTPATTYNFTISASVGIESVEASGNFTSKGLPPKSNGGGVSA